MPLLELNIVCQKPGEVQLSSGKYVPYRILSRTESRFLADDQGTCSSKSLPRECSREINNQRRGLTIVEIFVGVWAFALFYRHYGRVEERWERAGLRAQEARGR